MTPLTPQERAAVEASARLIGHPDPRFYAMQAEARKFHKDSLDARLTVYITLGHLSGFRAGVEAAIVALQETSPGLGALDDAEDRIRSLLTHHPQHTKPLTETHE